MYYCMVLPDFVDKEIRYIYDTYNYNKADIFYDIIDYYWLVEYDIDSDIYKWLDDKSNRNLLLKALVLGYDVEQEVN